MRLRPAEWLGTHQVGGEEGLEVEEKPSTGDLLQPTSAGFLGFLRVLGVCAVLVRLPANIVELNVETTKENVILILKYYGKCTAE